MNTSCASRFSPASSTPITVIDPSTIIMIAANTTQPAHPVMGSRGGVALLAALSSETTQSDSLVDDSLCDIAPPFAPGGRSAAARCRPRRPGLVLHSHGTHWPGGGHHPDGM